MPKCPGYWLDPSTQQRFRITRHEDFVQNSLRGYRFPPEIEQEIKQTEGEDELRMIGVRSGLIRTRKHVNSYISVQFYTDPQNVESFLQSVLTFCQETEIALNQDLKIDNLKTGDTVVLTLEELGSRLGNGKNVFWD
jgi:hypothetical protein